MKVGDEVAWVDELSGPIFGTVDAINEDYARVDWGNDVMSVERIENLEVI